MDFLPRPAQHDGTRCGNSFLSLWLNCRRKFVARYYWPHEDGSTGLETGLGQIQLGSRGLQGPGVNLMLGSMLHAYKEHWYASGIEHGQDLGEYSHTHALAKLVQYTESRRPEFADSDAFDFALVQVSSWCEAWDRHYGTGGFTPIYPEEKILCFEDGTPAIEQEFQVPLGYRDWVYTCRMDAVALWQDRYLVGLEHKSAAPSWVGRYISQLGKGSQFTGEMFVLRHSPELKDLPWDKIRVAFHLKGWTPKSTFPSPVQFGDVARTDEQLERFRHRVVRILQEIDGTLFTWNEAGRPTHGDLFDMLFPETGEHTQHCYAYNTECEFMGPCRMGFGSGTLGGFRASRHTPEEGTDDHQ